MPPRRKRSTKTRGRTRPLSMRLEEARAKLKIQEQIQELDNLKRKIISIREASEASKPRSSAKRTTTTRRKR